MDRDALQRWLEGYVSLWRAPGTDRLGELFADGIRYRPSPWRRAVVGLAALAAFWESGRDGPDEQFELRSEVVAVDGPVGVVRVGVDYADGERWRDLWIVHFDATGRCTAFEEWPFAPDQPDGHE